MAASGRAASKRRPSSSIAARVAAARVSCSGAQASAIAMLPCGAMAANTRPIRGASEELCQAAPEELAAARFHVGRQHRRHRLLAGLVDLVDGPAVARDRFAHE